VVAVIECSGTSRFATTALDERNFNRKTAKVVNLPVSLPLLRTINDVIE
jgi:hypothetical protein